MIYADVTTASGYISQLQRLEEKIACLEEVVPQASGTLKLDLLRRDKSTATTIFDFTSAADLVEIKTAMLVMLRRQAEELRKALANGGITDQGEASLSPIPLLSLRQTLN